MSYDAWLECSCSPSDPEDRVSREFRGGRDAEVLAMFRTLPALRALHATGVWALCTLEPETITAHGIAHFLLRHDGPGHVLTLVDDYGGREVLTNTSEGTPPSPTNTGG